MNICEHPWESCYSEASHVFVSERKGSWCGSYRVALCPQHLAEELAGGVGLDRAVSITPL